MHPSKENAMTKSRNSALLVHGKGMALSNKKRAKTGEWLSMSKWLLPIALLFLLGMASGIGFSSSGSGMTSGTGMPSSGPGMVSGTGLSSGTGQYTTWQQGVIEGLKIGFHMGQMHALAKQGQNISGFNAEVDNYNAWARQHFGDDANLLMSKIVTASGAPITSQSYYEASPISIGTEQRKPFNASSELGKFGKKQVMTEIPPGSLSQKYEEAIAVDQVLRNF
jgi:hypothetical protein